MSRPPRPALPEAGPLTGTEKLILIQDARARLGLLTMLQDWFLASVRTSIAAAVEPLLAKIATLENSDTAQANRDAAQDQKIEANRIADQAVAQVMAEQATRLATLETTRADEASHEAAQDAAIAANKSGLAKETTDRTSADSAFNTRVAAVENRPEEAALFTAVKALPAISLLNPALTLVLTPLVPAKTGDVLKAGERVTVSPAVPLPAGVNIAAVSVPSDGTVNMQLTTSIAISAGSPITWNITALR